MYIKYNALTLNIQFKQETKQLYHPNSRMCLDCDAAQREIFMTQCEDARTSQQWNIQKVNATLVEEAWRNRHKQV